jgi:tRNA-uridine 2-sulfurtransferase
MGNVRAIGLLSGGLDSMLAVKVLQRQGIEVEGIVFVTPFFGPEAAERAGAILQIPLRVQEITEVYLDRVLTRPRYGYGKNMNPCIDCHAFMFHLAGRRMEASGADFLFSGEVLGQRPFSQNRESLSTVAQLSGYPDSLVRPLSAKRLMETRPEREGRVDRSRLLDLQGRSRKPQMKLAETFGISEYPSPAGGCLLTDPAFSRRLRDLLKHDPSPDVRDLEMLKVGRHLRFDDVSKIVVGRREEENNRLERLWRPGDLRVWVEGIPGPTVLLRSTAESSPEALVFAAGLAVRYSDAAPGTARDVAYTDGNRQGSLRVSACEQEGIDRRMI